MQAGSSQDRRLVKTSTPGIYKRGSRYVVIFRDPRGKQRKRAARTLAEARELKASLTADVKRGEYRAGSRVTFAEYSDEWLSTYTGRTGRGIRPNTLDDYRDALRREAVPFFGRMQLVAIEPRDVKRFAAELSSRGLAPASVRKAVAPVRALLATAFEESLIRTNPAAGLRIAQRFEPEGEAVAKALTEEELSRFLAELPEGNRLFFEFLVQTGLRIGEAIALDWGDIDLGARRVYVRRRLSRGAMDAPKSKYGRRAVPLGAWVSQRLWRVRNGAPDEAPVFTTATGARIDPSNMLSRVVKPAARRAGVPWAHFHTLRHTCATILFRSGANAKQVQVWLGHHSPAFTLDTYVHLLPEDLPEPSCFDGLLARAEADATATQVAPEQSRSEARAMAASAIRSQRSFSFSSFNSTGGRDG
jgi:integrase